MSSAGLETIIDSPVSLFLFLIPSHAQVISLLISGNLLNSWRPTASCLDIQSDPNVS